MRPGGQGKQEDDDLTGAQHSIKTEPIVERNLTLFDFHGVVAIVDRLLIQFPSALTNE